MPANREQQVKAAERQRQALQLRQAGVAYEDIAQRLGYSGRSSAWRSVMAALKHTLQEPADEVRTLELARLDRLLLGLWPQAAAGNQGAVDRALRIMERRAKLLGLDAPTRQELSGPAGGPIEMITPTDIASARAALAAWEQGRFGSSDNGTDSDSEQSEA